MLKEHQTKIKRKLRISNQFSGDNRAVEPPEPISNSEVKRSIADGSVGLPCESRTSSESNTKALAAMLGLFLWK